MTILLRPMGGVRGGGDTIGAEGGASHLGELLHSVDVAEDGLLKAGVVARALEGWEE